MDTKNKTIHELKRRFQIERKLELILCKIREGYVKELRGGGEGKKGMLSKGGEEGKGCLGDLNCIM